MKKILSGNTGLELIKSSNEAVHEVGLGNLPPVDKVSLDVTDCGTSSSGEPLPVIVGQTLKEGFEVHNPYITREVKSCQDDITLKGIYPIGNLQPNTAAMKTRIPTVGEINEALRNAFAILVADHKKRGMKQNYIADKIKVDPNYVSRMASGKKGIGDDVAARIDSAFPGWRDIESNPSSSKADPEPITDRRAGPSFGMLLDSLKDPETLKKEILFCLEGMKPDNKIALLTIANHLYNNDNPGKHRGRPFTEQAPSTSKKAGTLKVGLANPEPGAERSAARESSTDRRVSKQRNR